MKTTFLTFFKLFLSIPLAITLLLSCKSEEKSKALLSTPPNIVVFLVDDMGWQDTSVPFWDEKTPFNELYRTPNMERLASEGMKFTQAYATAVCTPTRVSLMTGMNAARHKVTNWTLKKDVLQPMELNHETLSFPSWNMNGLSPVEGIANAVHATPLPQMLQDAGYFTIHSGKAHFGAIDTPGEDPLNIGFDVNIAGHAAGGLQSYLGTENFGNGIEGREVWAVPGLEKYHGQDIFLTEALTREALLELDKVVSSDQPFFLYLSHYAVHIPMYADGRFIQNYEEAGLAPEEAKYASMIEGMDKSLGDVMNYLEEKGVAENTVVIFMSDNGGLSAVGRGGQKHMHNLPLKSGKGSVYEGGIREPMIVKWPGMVKEGSSTNQQVIIEDFFPSILEIAGVKNSETIQKIDGRSFLPVLKGNGYLEERPLFWHYPNEWGISGPGIGASSAVRSGDFKMIYYHEDSRLELFNIKEDIGEENNLIDSNPTKAKELAKTLTDYLISVDAQMPSKKLTGERVKWPAEAI